METKKPLLSIIIPTFNEEKNLPLLLDSVAKQTFRDFEVIVADSAASKDKTRQVAEKRGCTVVEGGTVSEGRNRGASAASGRVFLFLDADVVLPNQFFLEDTVNEFIGRDLDLATCRVRALDGDAYDKLMHGIYNVYSVALGKILPHIPGFCFFIKRSVYEAVGGFDEQVKLAEDHELARRSAKIGTFGFLYTQCIPVSTRRFERDGRFVTAIKYMLCELHMLTIGPVKSDIFKYQWGHDGQKAKRLSAEKRGKSAKKGK
jgi:glycosyltransferase involved in cell wall biosynthesis